MTSSHAITISTNGSTTCAETRHLTPPASTSSHQHNQSHLKQQHLGNVANGGSDKGNHSTSPSCSKTPNFHNVYTIVRSLLYSKLDGRLLYHGADHTFGEVLPAAIRLAKWEKLTEEDTLIVKTAALFHDTGFLDQYDRNEPLGCQRAKDLLQENGYSENQVKRVCECVMATQMPQNPKGNLLAEVVCDADLAYLGTDNLFLRSECLRLELNAVKNLDISPRQWNITSLEFLRNHSYWTKSANERLKPIKEMHIHRMMELLNMQEGSNLE